ncbi:MAG: putative DNA binding domain-containing protein [Chloroflexi bacterium]|nr:putative DNA binding domain-containing protein [Chloroflexota bacterium]
MSEAGADDVRHRLTNGRDAAFDWMPSDAPREAVATALMAFANTRTGGQLLIGADSEGHLHGVADGEAALDRALSAALTLTPPLILPVPRIVDVDSRRAVLVTVPAGMSHVYSLNGRYLVRDGGASIPLTPPAMRRLLIERGDITYEAEPARDANRLDLDWERATQYAAVLGEADVEQALIKRGCLVRENGQALPTHAGILLFGRDPRRFVRGAEITAVRFAGEAMGDTFTRDDISGTLPEQIKRAETFLRDTLRKGVTLGGAMARSEQYEYPLEAVRELVVNAVAHRDYSIQGDGIRLYVFKDRMEITSPGRLPGPVTVANIKDERFSRNPALVQVLADMRYIERLGYGVDRVIELTRQHGLPEPLFSETDGGFKVTIYNALTSPSAVPVAPVMVEPQKPQTVDLLARHRGIPLNPRQESVLTYLSEPHNTRITNSELQRLHPDVHPETIRRDLSDLVTKDILLKMGEKRGSYYVLRKRD